MNDRFAENSRNVLSDIVETRILFSLCFFDFSTLGMRSSLTLQWYCASANDVPIANVDAEPMAGMRRRGLIAAVGCTAAS
jgi:hypothetical protein